MGFQNPVQARLRRNLKAQRQLGSPKHSPALLQLSVQIRVIGGFFPKILPKWSVERRESRVESFCRFLPLLSLIHVPPEPRSARADSSRRRRAARRRISQAAFRIFHKSARIRSKSDKTTGKFISTASHKTS
jgi:hypothetical protein